MESPMSSSYSSKIKVKPIVALSRAGRRKATTPTILLIAASLSNSIAPAMAQSGSYSRIVMQTAMQDEPSLKAKAKNSVRKPLDSDASYVCTLSGFGNLAHCYSR
jgi:hypothetical protein